MSDVERAYLKIARDRYGVSGMGSGDEIADNRKEHFIYGTEEAGISLAIAAGSTGTLTIDISQEADFICTKIVDTAVLGAAANVWSYEMVSSDTDRNMQNRPIPRANAVGTAQLPGIFSRPRIFWRNTRIRFIASRQVAGAVAADTIWVSLWGYKVFYDLSLLNLTSRSV
jgi:hypothetical protein